MRCLVLQNQQLIGRNSFHHHSSQPAQKLAAYQWDDHLSPPFRTFTTLGLCFSSSIFFSNRRLLISKSSFRVGSPFRSSSFRYPYSSSRFWSSRSLIFSFIIWIVMSLVSSSFLMKMLSTLYRCCTTTRSQYAWVSWQMLFSNWTSFFCMLRSYLAKLSSVFFRFSFSCQYSSSRRVSSSFLAGLASGSWLTKARTFSSLVIFWSSLMMSSWVLSLGVPSSGETALRAEFLYSLSSLARNAASVLKVSTYLSSQSFSLVIWSHLILRELICSSWTMCRFFSISSCLCSQVRQSVSFSSIGTIFFQFQKSGTDFCFKSTKMWFFSCQMYFPLASTSFSDLSSSACSSATVSSLLILGVFLIFLAEIPNRRVEMVSARLLGWGEQVTIRVVFELPPRDSWRTRVSLLSRQGMCVLFPSVRALMTLPRVVRLALIFFASSSVFPYAPVFAIFSLPARSTRYSLPVLAVRSTVLFWLIVRMKIMCEREERSFMLVAAMDLKFLAISINLQTSSMEEMQFSVRSSMNIPRFLSDLIFRSFLLLSNRSFNFSMQSSTKDTLILNSTFSQKPAIESKTCLTMRGMIPDCSLMASPMAPYMVCVFPDAVCPQAKIVPLKPSMTLSMMDDAAQEQTSACVVFTSKILSKENLRGYFSFSRTESVLSSSISWQWAAPRAFSFSLRGRKRQTTFTLAPAPPVAGLLLEVVAGRYCVAMGRRLQFKC